MLRLERSKLIWPRFDLSICVDACSVIYILLTGKNKKKQKKTKAGRPWNPDCSGRKQLDDITDNVNIALADTSILSDFEP